MRAIGIISLICAALTAASCAHPAESGRWVGEIQEANRMADRAIGDGKLVAARSVLKEALEKPAPPEMDDHDAKAIKQDICFRLAMLEIEARRPQAALDWTDRGLQLGTSEDLFTANLLVARGSALETLGRDSRAAGEYHRALKINEKLLGAALGQED